MQSIIRRALNESSLAYFLTLLKYNSFRFQLNTQNASTKIERKKIFKSQTSGYVHAAVSVHRHQLHNLFYITHMANALFSSSSNYSPYALIIRHSASSSSHTPTKKRHTHNMQRMCAEKITQKKTKTISEMITYYSWTQSGRVQQGKPHTIFFQKTKLMANIFTNKNF